jgi:hypothetical protein
MPSTSLAEIMEEVLNFFQRRFSAHWRVKLDHRQWERVGNDIWDTWEKGAQRNGESFSTLIRRQCGLGRASKEFTRAIER